MQTKDDLIRENAILHARLDLAERWMQREVQTAMQSIQKQGVKSQVRKHFANLLEEEGVDIIARRVHETFGQGLQNAPAFTLERLIDAEIYWQTLQKYPTMDGLPIVLAYQKILDAWVEKVLIAPWRSSFSPEKGRLRGVTQSGISYGVTHPNPSPALPRFAQVAFSGRGQEQIARDIENIITKKYTLSLGRLYQVTQMIRSGSILPLEKGGRGDLVSELANFWQSQVPDIYATLVSDEFFLPFSELMNREIFTKKRHEKKVTFSDVKKVRENLLSQMLPHIL